MQIDHLLGGLSGMRVSTEGILRRDAEGGCAVASWLTTAVFQCFAIIMGLRCEIRA